MIIDYLLVALHYQSLIGTGEFYVPSNANVLRYTFSSKQPEETHALEADHRVAPTENAAADAD